MKGWGALVLMIMVTAAHADVVIQNFANGQPVTRYDTSWNRLDAHDGGIAQFGQMFYLYGTSYNCGFQWNTTSPWCGFEVYSSPDLVTWTDHGKLFDPSPYQALCGTNGGGCFRPHMIYNKATGNYILWFEGEGAAYGNTFAEDFHAMVCIAPTGPCQEVLPQPHLVGAGGNTPFSDFNLFVDDDGTGYVIYDDNNEILIDQLNYRYTDSDGKSASVVGASQDEAPALFKRAGVYYAIYGHSCGYCVSTDTSYSYTAGAVLGAWTSGGVLNPTSCGGQSSNVATLTVGTATLYLYESDLWLGTPNEAAAGRFDDLLSFGGQQINPFACDASVTISGLNPVQQQIGWGVSGVEGLNGDLMFTPMNAGFRGFNTLYNEFYDGSAFRYTEPGYAAHVTFDNNLGELDFGVAPMGQGGSPVPGGLPEQLSITGAGVSFPTIGAGTPAAYACFDATQKLIISATKCTAN